MKLFSKIHLNLKTFLRMLLYTSLISVLAYLYFNGLLIIPELRNHFWFFMSVFLIVCGYFIESLAWHTIVRTKIIRLSFRDAFISNGKYIFSKYIPGKLWIIAGRAGYINEKYSKSFVDLASFSFYYQIITIFSGTIIGFGIVYYIDVRWFWLLGLLIIITLIIIALFYIKVVNITSTVLSYIFKRTIILPSIATRTSLQLLLLSLGNWLIWSLAFYLLLLSIHSIGYISLKAGLVFPISSVIGIIVLIAPGGLGFREGFIALGLTAIGIQTKDAASIAVLSRLWFLIGEFLFFVIAIVLERFPQKRTSNPVTKTPV